MFIELLSIWKCPNRFSSLQVPETGRSYTRFAAVLEGDVAAFDAAAFRLARPEAIPLDPHARLLLEQTAVRYTLSPLHTHTPPPTHPPTSTLSHRPFFVCCALARVAVTRWNRVQVRSSPRLVRTAHFDVAAL